MKKWFKRLALLLMALWCLLVIYGLCVPAEPSVVVAPTVAAPLPPPPAAPSPGLWQTVESFLREHPQVIIGALVILWCIFGSGGRPPAPPLSDFPPGQPKDWRPGDVMQAFSNDSDLSEESLAWFIIGLMDYYPQGPATVLLLLLLLLQLVKICRR